MQRPCPICKKPTDSAVDADFPFCSERCRLLDLGNWSSGKYVVPEPMFDPDQEAQARNGSPDSDDTQH